MSCDHFQVPGLCLPALGSRRGILFGAHMLHTWKQRVGALWSRPMGVRATPRCSPFLPGEVETEASHEGSSEGPGRCNPRWVTRSKHGLGWTFPPSCLLPPAPQSCSWGWSEPGIQLCSWGTTGSSKLGCREALSVCSQSHRQPWRRGSR